MKANPRGIGTLDSYTVVFAWGEKQTFWDAQLESVPRKPDAA